MRRFLWPVSRNVVKQSRLSGRPQRVSRDTPYPSYVEGIIFSQVSVHRAVGVRVPFMTCPGPTTLVQWGTLGSLVNGWRLTGDDDMMSSTEGKEATLGPRGRSCECLQSFLHGLSEQSILKLWEEQIPWRKVCLHIRSLFNCGRERES